MTPSGECQDNSADIKRAEDHLVVQRDPGRQKNIEVRAPVLRVSSGHCSEGATPAVEAQDENLDQNDPNHERRMTIASLPGKQPDSENARDKKGPDNRVSNLDRHESDFCVRQTHVASVFSTGLRAE